MKRLILVLLVVVGLQAKAQMIPCDSISYAITSSPNSMILQLDGGVALGFPGVVTNWDWLICSVSGLCYPNTGQTAYFQQLSTTDTLQVCLTTTLDINGNTYTCIQCDTLVFGANGWMLMNMGPPMIIQESNLNSHRTLVKVLDIFGRESKAVNQLLFYIYNDGTIEKRAIVD